MNRFADPGPLVSRNVGINRVNCSLVVSVRKAGPSRPRISRQFGLM